MKKSLFLTIFLCILTLYANAQTKSIFKDAVPRKGRIFGYWGWNWAAYTKSNIHFSGSGYNFTLDKVVAHDRPTPFDVKEYFDPASFTVPQYDYRIGYFISNQWSISVGFDHMKYVMDQNQIVNITGSIAGQDPKFNGTYTNQPIQLTDDFLTFEHTDGLNYINAELSHYRRLSSSKNGKVSIDLVNGLGAGIMIPKTNVKLFNYDRNDQWHVSGFGLSTNLGLSFNFHGVFLMPQLKGGLISMPNVITTANHRVDKAGHHFFFLEKSILFGFAIPLKSILQKS
ncbi:hypothetical protein [Xanthocytophaga agilis]|uniref:Outer membrane protein beta-barrel domain-containing protein n=1 Tax=Xanthocytophaga agilis TaxID=3048010 RepID=A0AAE3R971_9BACT|nr:hypothetical protein [Xanthocytophaga agilis]MDJ1503719.1 hypothetical protein [Xanthocytophaga agilis]